MKIGLCTDSSSQLPTDLVERFEIEVVPVTVSIDEHEYLEGLDISPDTFYAMFDAHHRPTVSTTQPSPGQFALAFEELIGRGCTEILSIHMSAVLSNTLNSARLAAHRLDVPVRLVDSGMVSFGVGCCVWAAGDAIAGGCSLDEAATVAESLAPSIGHVFIVGALDLIVASGRPCAPDLAGDGIPVLGLRDSQVQVIDRVDTVVDAVNSMASAAVHWGDRLNVAVGMTDRAAEPLADALAAAVGETATVDEVIRYRLGPSVGAHTGPGTVECFMFPSTLARSTPATS